MKINGIEPGGPAEEILVLPRIKGPDLVFRAIAVLDDTEFETKCPLPKPRAVLIAGGEWKKSLDDPKYIQAINDHGRLRFAWILLKSLEPSNIEWDTVDMDRPSTWFNWEKDFKENGLSQTEINHVTNCVASANALNQQKLDAAREDFLRGLAKASEKSSFPNTEQENTPSGEPVSDLASDHQE